MRILLVVNARSGKGRGNAAANRLGSLLAAHSVSRIDIPRDPRRDFQWLSPRLHESELCVIVGGDGTLHGVLPALVESRIPVFHAATGTENLFARQFGSFARDFDHVGTWLLAALKTPKILDVDVGRTSGLEHSTRYFSLMLSAGPDASVISRLSRVRTGAISHWSYLRPIVAEATDPYLPNVDVAVDGVALCPPAPGLLLIANARQYALRIDPAPDASMSDGLLDILFLPASSTPLPAWLCRASRQDDPRTRQTSQLQTHRPTKPPCGSGRWRIAQPRGGSEQNR
ncbi:MAG: diacylglycerol kinase family protein [Planctomycetota bacterium]|nr:diacylglycerol kinase family protein [Planctomycetota bacterium]